MVEKLLRSNLKFFDKNHIGKIMVRFAKEIGVFDYEFSFSFMIFTFGIFKIGSAIVIISVINYWLIPISIVTTLVFVLFLRVFEKPMISIVKFEAS